jgi:hypothetical protein
MLLNRSFTAATEAVPLLATNCCMLLLLAAFLVAYSPVQRWYLKQLCVRHDLKRAIRTFTYLQAGLLARIR